MQEDIKNYNNPKDHFLGVATLFLLVGTVFLGIWTIREIKGKNTIGGPSISVNGKGEVFAIPDIALITFSIREEAKTSKEATSKLASKEVKALDFLSSNDIAQKDIKTISINTYPKYEYKKTNLVCTSVWCPPDYGRQEIVGFEATETIQVKIRNTEIVGNIIDGLANVEVGEINGPEFSVDDLDSLKSQARKLAIEDAKKKASVLKKDLGVRLVRIISYNEGGDYPIYYGYGMGGDVAKMESSIPASVPSVSTGEQKIVSNITIVYEIR